MRGTFRNRSTSARWHRRRGGSKGVATSRRFNRRAPRSIRPSARSTNCGLRIADCGLTSTCARTAFCVTWSARSWDRSSTSAADAARRRGSTTCSPRAIGRRRVGARRPRGCSSSASSTALQSPFMSLEQLLASIPPGSPDEALARQINFDQLPAHIAVIMDGNGRWAAKRHLPRVEGHRAGIDSVRDVVETSARLGIGVLTLYAFSVENWKRPRPEINTLMTLLKRYLRLELTTLLKNNIRFRVIGRADELSPDVQDELGIGTQKTEKNTGMLFNIALNYGGRAEIVDAARRAIASGIPADALDERTFGEVLYTAGQPEPDLLIRTSGEMRVSNFLLWQIAYSEIWVTETLWPDFRRRDLLDAVVAYQKRERRYGGIKSPIAIGAK